MFLIEKACAGVNFMIAAFAVVVFALLHRAGTLRHGAGIIAVSLLASYVAAVLVNTARIVIAMWLAAHPIGWSSLTPADIHRLEGITVYFGGLMLLYALVQRIDRGGAVFRFVLPLGCYYLVTLGLPLANGAAQASDAFLTHAVIVLLVPPVLILLGSGAWLLFSRYPRRNVSAGSSAHARLTGRAAAPPATRIIAPAANR
jgi:exosortase/archaeosortase family protein